MRVCVRACVRVCAYVCVCVCAPDNEDLMKVLNPLVYFYTVSALTKLPLQLQPSWALCCQQKEVLERESEEGEN